MKKIIIALLLLMHVGMWVLTPDQIDAYEADEKQPVSIESQDNNYSTIYQKWLSEGLRDDILFSEVISPSDFRFEQDKDGIYSETNEVYSSFLSENNLRDLDDPYLFEFNKIEEEQTHKVEVEVTVEETGLYAIALDYYSKTTSIREIEIAIEINQETQYYEQSQITLNTFWQTDKTINKDRYGNDIMPNASQLYQWNHVYLRDASRIQERAIVFKLEAGNNKITINLNSGQMILGQLYVSNKPEYLSYDEYLNAHEASKMTKEKVSIEAEDMVYKNTLAVRFGTDRNPTIKPFSITKNRLNIVDGSTFNDAGQAIYYEALIPESGYYYITLKVRQSKNHTTVFRTLTIDGEVPFEEALTIPFKYQSKWYNQKLTDTLGEALLFYFEKGTHQIGLEVNAEPVKEIYENVRYVMNGINELALDIKKLTGNNVDENRDWDIVDFMPNLQSDLNRYATLIKNSYQDWMRINQTSKTSEISSGLRFAYEQLGELAKSPNKVPSRIQRLSTGDSSVLSRLGIILPLIIESPLSIDLIHIHGETAKIPKANANFFKRVWVSIRRFFASFFSDQYTTKGNKNELEVWVNRSRQYVNLMQQMADNEFTPQTGIKVKISIMPNEDKLILAASSNTEPDIAMGVAGWRPYDFAIRNAVLDLREFEGFTEVANRFESGAFMQLAYQNGIYGLPETQNFNVLFYRRDILDNLELEVPNTWQEVVDMLPELQRYGMNFYSMLSGSSAFKAFVTTMPFINQYGGEIYGEGALSAALDHEKTIEAITFMTDLFTVYSLPLETGSFYNQFRYGNMPLGIGDFGMYVQLLHAAPEIAGLWSVAPLPGIINEQGVVDRSYDGAATSAMIFKNTDKKDESWQFLDWWSKDETQINYSETLITSMGAEYMWNTANKNAFKEISWDEAHKKVFIEQWEWIHDTPKTPASYMLEREISNIWNKIVYNGENVRTAIEDSQVIVNKEITRKMIEFGFINKQGQLLKTYILPTIETIDDWMKSYE